MDYFSKLNEELCAACQVGDGKRALQLINMGADMNVSGAAAAIGGASALIIACCHGNRDVALQLLDRGADIDKGDDQGFTALHHAASQLGPTGAEMALLLLSRGASVNVRNCRGETALHLIVRKCIGNNNKDMALKLVWWGADIDMANNDMETPLDVTKVYKLGFDNIPHIPHILDVVDAAAAADAAADADDDDDDDNNDDSDDDNNDDSFDDYFCEDLLATIELRSALILERKKYLAWTRRKAFMMFLVGYSYIARQGASTSISSDHTKERKVASESLFSWINRQASSVISFIRGPTAAKILVESTQQKEQPVDTVMREVNRHIVSFL